MNIYEKLHTDCIITDYLFNICKKNRILYVETPKVACTTIKYALQVAEDQTCADKSAGAVHDRETSPLLRPSDDIALFYEAVMGNFFRFSFVRNPFTRVLSCYLDKIQKPHSVFRKQIDIDPEAEVSFYDFLATLSVDGNLKKNLHWAPQFMLLSYDVIAYNFLGRFEYIREELKKLQAITGIDFSERKSPHAQNTEELVAAFYTQKEINLVAKLYGPDFKFFGYTKDIRAI